MNKKIIFITILSFALTACTQTQPQSGSGSPFIDAYKKTEDIKETAEEHKGAVERVLDEDVPREKNE